MTEEEWTEQVLNFEPYKRRGPMYLDKASTERLLEQLEDAQALLAQMLTSRQDIKFDTKCSFIRLLFTQFKFIFSFPWYYKYHHGKRWLTFCRYIGPLREEAASWAEKLKEVSEVLEQWLEVQDLWQYLEAVFSNAEAAKVKAALERSKNIDKSI